ncbi:acyl-CoA carboxylase epsilon subunit [Streptomyces sp. NY05-11A]|uniref:acyl-CoA carboxylase epsilon subunit n=1 Tax=Streptomyces soliscabiei TaxID=588897 RepID=UPI0029B12942|nr:acyl-CoA carboxylase epsilon subunit [Streptomyces sp. NY05-11A]MDX2680489.1 acyl-CoA carboxylase epsilon subunit [Streptomyces sp. NY05-11A]
MSTRRSTPAQAPQSPPRTPHSGPAATDGVPLSTALAMASFRISRGNPTSEETAAVAAVLVAGLRRLHDTGPATAGPRILRLPRRTRPTYRAPGSWAS